MDQASAANQSSQLRVIVGERRAFFADIELCLTAREFDVLALLAERPGWVLTAEQLAEDDHAAGASPYAVNVHISHLRAKLGEAGAPRDLIETVRGVGWRLTRPQAEKPALHQRAQLAGRCIANARRSFAAYEFERAVQSLDEALEHVESSDLEPLRRERVCSAVLERRGAAYSALGRYAEARRDYEQALARRPSADHCARARLNTRIAHASVFCRSRGTAERAFTDARHELDQVEKRDRAWWQAWIEIQLQRTLTMCATDLPLCDRAGGAELRAAVDSYGTATQEAKYHLAVADTLFYDARWAATPECLAESRLGFESALRTDSAVLQSLATGELGSMLVFAGEYAEAEIRLQQAIDFARRCRDTVGVHAATMFLSIAARLQGDVRRAEHFALELRSLIAEQATMPEFECTVLGQLAWVALRRHDVALAERLSDEAIGCWQRDPSMSQSVWVMAWPATSCGLQAGDADRAFECARLMTRADQQVLAAEMDVRLAAAVDAHLCGDPAGERLLRELEAEARALGYC